MGFFTNTSMTSVTIGNNVTWKDGAMDGAFEGCTAFNKKINIPSGVTSIKETFNRCSSLNVAPNIPNTVIDISYAFGYCSNFNQVVNIPNSVTNMAHAFEYCYNWNRGGATNIPEGVMDMSYAFRNCNKILYPPVMPENGKMNMAYAFTGCNAISYQINIPNGVTCIEGIFSDTSTNLLVNIPNTVIDMSRAFLRCNRFNRNVVIPNSVQNMSYTFNGCTNLNHNIAIPENVSDLSYAFAFCNTLKQNIAIVPNLITNEGPRINARGMFQNCKGLYSVNINIPSHRIVDASYMFYGASLSGNNSIVCFNNGMYPTFDENGNWTGVAAFDPIVENTAYMFANTSLSDNSFSCILSPPDSVLNAYGMFYNCPYLNTYISVGRSVKDASYMFYNCSNFSGSVYFKGNNVSTVYNMFGNIRATNAFYSTVDMEFPDSVVNYVNTYWSSYSLKYANITIGNGAQNLYQMFYQCVNMYGNVFIWSNDVTNAYRMINGRNSSKGRLNIYIRPGGQTETTFRRNASTTSICGNAFIWVNTTNGFYNSGRNIYVYNNLGVEAAE